MIGRIHHRRRVLAYYGLELGFGAGAFLLAHALRAALQPHFEQQVGPLADVLWLLPVFLALWSAFAWTGDAYGSFRQHGAVQHAARLLLSNGLAVFSVFAILALVKRHEVNRSLVAMVGLMHFALVLPLRLSTRALLAYYTSKGYDRHFVLVGGALDEAVRIARRLDAWPGRVFQVKGLVAEGASPPGELEGYRVLGSLAEVPEIARREVVDEVFLVVTQPDLGPVLKAVRECDAMGVVVHLNLPVFEEIASRLETTAVDDRNFLTFSALPPREFQLFVKRAGDIAGSLLLLLLLSPVLLVTALAVALGSPGGAIFRQQRVGRNGRTFVLYKFRTMASGAEAQRAALEAKNELDGPAFKIKDDPRVTRLGRFLRKSSLDELPQLWNVLKGDMSLVGPRPLPDYEVEKFQPWHRRRMSMRPGITGLWQISGRNEVRFDDWMRLDLEYIDRWSLWLDAAILLRTLPAVVLRKGAY